MDRLCKVGDVIKSKRLQHNFYRGQDVISLSELEPGGCLGNGWVVVRAVSQGGGVVHGHDVYPDGWCVTVKMLSGGSGEIYEKVIGIQFYQTGCFSVLLPPDEIELLEEVDLIPRQEVGRVKKVIAYTPEKS